MFLILNWQKQFFWKQVQEPFNSCQVFLRYLLHTATLLQDYSCVQIKRKEESVISSLPSPCREEYKARHMHLESREVTVFPGKIPIYDQCTCIFLVFILIFLILCCCNFSLFIPPFIKNYLYFPLSSHLQLLF